MDVNELGTEEAEGLRKSTRVVKTKKVAGFTSLGSADIETECTLFTRLCDTKGENSSQSRVH